MSKRQEPFVSRCLDASTLRGTDMWNTGQQAVTGHLDFSPGQKEYRRKKKKKNMDLGVLTSWPKFLFKKRKQEILSIL